MKIYGVVQGVGFRDGAAKKARALGLCGWVRNCEEGCVETEVEGAVDVVEKYRAWCKKGPTFARVGRVEEESCEVQGDVISFEIR